MFAESGMREACAESDHQPESEERNGQSTAASEWLVQIVCSPSEEGGSDAAKTNEECQRQRKAAWQRLAVLQNGHAAELKKGGAVQPPSQESFLVAH